MGQSPELSVRVLHDGAEAQALLDTADRNMYAQKWLRKAGRLSHEEGTLEISADVPERAGPPCDRR